MRHKKFAALSAVAALAAFPAGASAQEIEFLTQETNQTNVAVVNQTAASAYKGTATNWSSVEQVNAAFQQQSLNLSIALNGNGNDDE